jgi:hypothetical protein
MKNITQDFILDYVVYTATTSITFKEHLLDFTLLINLKICRLYHMGYV